MDPELSRRVDPSAPRGFARFRQRAANLAGDPAAVRRLVNEAAGKLERRARLSERVAAVREELTLMMDLARAYVSGEYRAVSSWSLVTVLAALLYFVVPMDLIPDFLVGVGLIDDVTVIAYAMRAVREELDAFVRWRDEA